MEPGFQPVQRAPGFRDMQRGYGAEPDLEGGKQQMASHGDKVTEHCKHTFTREEMEALADKMTQGLQEKDQIEDEFKAVKADFKHRLESKEAEVKNLTRKYRDGYEYRDTPCTIIIRHKDGLVDTVRDDSGEVVRTRRMNEEERQHQLPVSGDEVDAEFFDDEESDRAA